MELTRLFTGFLVMQLMLCSVLNAQTSSQKMLIENYHSDLHFLRKALESNYPSLYRFQSERKVDKLFEASHRSIDSTTNDLDFYRAIKQLLSGLQDGHLSCSPSDSINKSIDETQKYFPLSIVFLQDKVFVDCDPKQRLSAGAEIIAINGEPVKKIRQKLFGYIVSDGKIETKKYHILNHSFWFYHWLVYGPTEKYQVKLRHSNGKTSEMTLNALTLSDLSCQSMLEEKETQSLELTYPQSNTALLTIRTFSRDEISDAGQDFESFLHAGFTEIKQQNVENLIIDLRNNGGGKDTYGALLYSYLTDQPFRYYESLLTSSGALSKKDHLNLAVQQPNELHFNGNLFVLTNGQSFSVTAEFCAIARSNKRAIFVGEETGGTLCGNTSGKFKTVALTYSGMTVTMPTIKYTMSAPKSKNSNRGIMPDHSVSPDIEELINQEDVVLEHALELIRKKKQSF